MKKFLLFALILIVLSIQGYTQVSSYSFTQSVLTYSAITGGTQLVNGTSSMDSWVSAAVTIPSFTFNGVAYTTAYVTSNGEISLGGTAPSAYSYTGISAGVGSGINICPFSADLDRGTTTATSEIRWEMVGSEVVFQWQQVKRYLQTESFDMQVRLNTVTGAILFVYQLNSGPGSGTSYQPEVGIRVSATDYNNRLVGSGTEDWATSLPGTANTNACRFTSTVPAKGFVTGLTYSFSPPAPGTPLVPTTPVPAIAAVNIPVNGSLTWAFGTNTLTYDLKFGPTGNITQVVTGASAGANGSYTYTALANAAGYQWQVIEHNGALTTTGPVWNFTTACAGYPLPLSEGFNAVTLPLCWTTQLLTATGEKISFVASSPNQTATPQEGADFVLFNSYYSTGGGAGAEERLITPAIVTTGSPNVNVEFYWFESGSTVYTNVAEGVQVEWSVNGTTWTNSTFYPRYVSTAPTSGAWVKKVITLPAGAGGIPSLYVSFKFHSEYGYNCYMDNVLIRATPTCFEPTALTVSAITTSTASISWTAAVPAPANGYDIYYSTSSIPPTASTTPSGSVAAGITTFPMTGLLSSTTYYAWVRSVCSASDKSSWGGPVSFTTLCGTISSFPWSENFDAMTSTGNTILPNCWLSSTTTGTPWFTGTAASITYNDPCSSPNYVYVYYVPSLADKFLFTPAFTLTASTSYDFKFSWTGDGYAGWTGDVLVNNAQNGTGATALSPSFVVAATTTNASCTQVKRTFVPSVSGTYYFMIRVNNTSVPYYLGFDDFRLELSPSCIEPTALSVSAVTSSTATVSWTAAVPAPANGYDIYRSTSATPPGAITTPTGSVAAGVTTYNMTGLLPTTQYYIWVRSVCSVSDKSSWAGPATFTTACPPVVTFPFTESFDGTIFAPGCWSNLKTAGTGTPGTWDRQTAGTNPACTPHSGAGMSRYNSFSLASGTKGILVTPLLNMISDQYFVHFWMYRDNGYTTNPDLVNIYYNTGPSTTGATLLGTVNRYYLMAPAEATANQWYQYTFNVPAGSSGGAYIVFEAVSAYGNNMFIDDISVTGPPCDVPSVLTAGNITTNAADLGWTSAASAWEYQYGLAGFTPASSGTASSANPTHISGLTGNTSYDFYVRASCSGNFSPWAGPKNFTTAATPPLVVTLPATLVSTTGATINGTVNANGASSAVSFDYGLTAAYGTNVPGVPPTVTGNTATGSLAALTGLYPNTTYHYRINGTNSGGTSNGLDMTFTTAAAPPTVVTNPAGNIITNGATLNGTVTANNQATTVTFDWGLTTAYGNSTNAVPPSVSGITATNVNAVLTGLLTSTTYHFRCVGVNATGTSYGADQSFLTGCPPTGPAGTITGPASVCSGAAGVVYSVPVITNATGYAWTLPAGATITAGANSNSITVTFGSTSGSISVQGTGACGNGTPASLAVTVNPLPVPTVSGPSSACLGSITNVYTTQAGMSSYLWTVSAGGTITAGAGTNSVTVKWNVTGAQSVSVLYANANGCVAAAPGTFAVNVLAAPVPTITGPASMCVNSGYYDYVTQAGANSYTWTISSGGTITFGQGTSQVQVTWNAPGPQWVAVNYTNASGCSAAVPFQYAVTVNPLPGPAQSITGTAAMCGGTTGVAYSVAAVTNASTYVWLLPPGATIATGAGTNAITVNFATNASSGNITVSGNNLCGNGAASPPFAVTVNPIPAAPVISAAGSVLTSSSAYGNQWYLNGSLLTGGTAQSYAATATGFYWSVVTLNGCVSDTSNHIYILITGTENLQSSADFSIYPNPSDGRFTIRLKGLPDGVYSAELMNSIGVPVWSIRNIAVSGDYEKALDIRPAANGVYTLILHGANSTLIRKILINY